MTDVAKRLRRHPAITYGIAPPRTPSNDRYVLPSHRVPYQQPPASPDHDLFLQADHVPTRPV